MEVIISEWLDLQIGVFDNYEDYVIVADEKGIEKYSKPNGTRAFYQYAESTEGETFFVVCFIDENPMLRTVVHEVSHITDCIFEHHGIEPCTETRAYFQAWLFDKIHDLLAG